MNRSPSSEPSKSILRKHGHKATGPRLAILAAFKKSKSPMSAQEIIGALRDDIDQATVYRTIKSLKETGIIRQVDLRHNHAHYEPSDVADHHHIICLRCGRVEDVEHQSVAAMESAIARSTKHFATIQEHTLEFYGICKSCSKKDREQE